MSTLMMINNNKVFKFSWSTWGNLKKNMLLADVKFRKMTKKEIKMNEKGKQREK